jgi:hypothetical protein
MNNKTIKIKNKINKKIKKTLKKKKRMVCKEEKNPPERVGHEGGSLLRERVCRGWENYALGFCHHIP